MAEQTCTDVMNQLTKDVRYYRDKPSASIYTRNMSFRRGNISAFSEFEMMAYCTHSTFKNYRGNVSAFQAFYLASAILNLFHLFQHGWILPKAKLINKQKCITDSRELQRVYVIVTHNAFGSSMLLHYLLLIINFTENEVQEDTFCAKLLKPILWCSLYIWQWK